MKNIAIIPARSGSKGLPDKNLRMVNGKPLMAYTIEAALESGCFDTVHVSPDSEKYAEIARQYGADVPFLRSEALATDTSAASIVYAIRGLPFTIRIFISGRPFEPLRAGMIAIFFITFRKAFLSFFQVQTSGPYPAIHFH